MTEKEADEHTPTPWQVDENGAIYQPFFGGDIVARVTAHNRAADAELIVRAVNSHDDLVAALRKAGDELRSVCGDFDYNLPLRLCIDAALSKAEGRS